MKINKLAQPSRTETSYDEVKMHLFTPPGGKTHMLYVRVYIPTELQPLYGNKAEIKKSTRTTDRLLAEARAAAIVLGLKKEFLEKRQLLLPLSGKPNLQAVLDEPLIQKIADIRLANLAWFDDSERNTMEEESEWQEHEDHIATTVADLQKIISRRKAAPGYKNFTEQAIEFADTAGYDIDKNDPMLPSFIDAMLKAEKRGYELMLRRTHGELAQLDEGESGPWLSDLLLAWEQENTLHLPDKTRGTYKTRIEHFIKFTEDKLVARIEKKDVWNWISKLIFTDELSPKTVKDGYLPAIRSLFEFGLQSGRFNLKINPAKDIKLPKISNDELAKRSNPRHLLNKNYINALFASPWYAGISSQLPKTVTEVVITGNARYWVPLIACIQGLRAEEICQLTLSDVGFQSGVFSIKITEESGRTKNEASQRWVSVHRQLLDLGFEEFISHQRSTQKVPEPQDEFIEHGPGEKKARPRQSGKLFPELHTKFERKSTYFLRKLNDYMHQELSFERGYSFHSFRHYWEDVLRRVTAQTSANGLVWPKGMSERISGRSQADIIKVEGSGAGYGGPIPPKLMQPFLDCLDFPGVTFPKPWSEFKSK